SSPRGGTPTITSSAPLPWRTSTTPRRLGGTGSWPRPCSSCAAPARTTTPWSSARGRRWGPERAGHGRGSGQFEVAEGERHRRLDHPAGEPAHQSPRRDVLHRHARVAALRELVADLRPDGGNRSHLGVQGVGSQGAGVLARTALKPALRPV